MLEVPEASEVPEAPRSRITHHAPRITHHVPLCLVVVAGLLLGGLLAWVVDLAAALPGSEVAAPPAALTVGLMAGLLVAFWWVCARAGTFLTAEGNGFRFSVLLGSQSAIGNRQSAIRSIRNPQSAIRNWPRRLAWPCLAALGVVLSPALTRLPPHVVQSALIRFSPDTFAGHPERFTPEVGPLVGLLYLFGALLVVCVAGQLVLLLRGVLSAEAVMHQSRRSVAAHLLAVTAMAYLLLAGWTMLAQSTTGDEPHYLLATHSLWRGGDVELGRNYAARDFAAFYPTDLLRRALGVRLELDPHDTPGADSRGRLVGWLVSWLAPNQQTSKPANQQTSKRSGRYPIHSLGLSLLILPAYAVAGHVGVVVFLTLLAALLAVSAFWLTDELFGERRAALFAWATFAFLTPLLYYSGMVQAEVTAGLSLALLVGIAWRAPAETHRKTALTVGSIALFALPWLHVKFIPLAGLLLVIWLVRGSWLVDSSKVGSLVSWLVGSLRGSRPASQQTSKPANQQTSKLLLWPVAAFVASLLALALFHQSIYGSPWPDAPHRNAAGKYPSLLSGNPLRGGFGLLLDQQDGLLPAALVLWLAGPGLLRAVRGFRISDFGFRKTDFEASDPQSRFRNSQSENGRRAVPVAAALLGSVFGVQFALLAPYLLWGSGYGPPGRQLLPVLALIMPFVGLGWQACEEALPSPQRGGVGGGVRRAWWLVPTLFNGLWVILLTIVPRLRFPLYDDTLSIARQPVITLLSAATHLD